MIDVLSGTYVNINSPIHNINVKYKIPCFLAMIILTLTAKSYVVYIIDFLILAICILISKLNIKHFISAISRLWLFYLIIQIYFQKITQNWQEKESINYTKIFQGGTNLKIINIACFICFILMIIIGIVYNFLDIALSWGIINLSMDIRTELEIIGYIVLLTFFILMIIIIKVEKGK